MKFRYETIDDLFEEARNERIPLSENGRRTAIKTIYNELRTWGYGAEDSITKINLSLYSLTQEKIDSDKAIAMIRKKMDYIVNLSSIKFSEVSTSWFSYDYPYETLESHLKSNYPKKGKRPQSDYRDKEEDSTIITAPVKIVPCYKSLYKERYVTQNIHELEIRLHDMLSKFGIDEHRIEFIFSKIGGRWDSDGKVLAYSDAIDKAEQIKNYDVPVGNIDERWFSLQWSPKRLDRFLLNHYPILIKKNEDDREKGYP